MNMRQCSDSSNFINKSTSSIDCNLVINSTGFFESFGHSSYFFILLLYYNYYQFLWIFEENLIILSTHLFVIFTSLSVSLKVLNLVEKIKNF